MIAPTKIFDTVVIGIVLGCSVVVIVISAAVAFAWFSSTPVSAMGVFDGSFSREKEMPVFNFAFHGKGTLALIVVIAGVYVFGATRSARRRSG